MDKVRHQERNVGLIEGRRGVVVEGLMNGSRVKGWEGGREGGRKG